MVDNTAPAPGFADGGSFRLVQTFFGKVVQIVTLPFGGCFGVTQTIPQGYVGLLLEFGRYNRTLSPGLWQINPVTQKVILVDIRTLVLDVRPQVAMTADNVEVSTTREDGHT